MLTFDVFNGAQQCTNDLAPRRRTGEVIFIVQLGSEAIAQVSQFEFLKPGSGGFEVAF